MIGNQKGHISSVYFAPRGRRRIFELGIQLSQIYLSPFDKIIGVIGDPGSGKSALIKGMFPALDLTNDDDGVNIRPLPLLDQDRVSFFAPHTYHLDVRFEMGFTQLSVLADAIKKAVKREKRVIVEHFDLIYPILGLNADLLIGIGEEIVLRRPNIFGPKPQEVADIVHNSLSYRLMAHTAEDLCEFCMPSHEMERCVHDDIKHGFILGFPETKPSFEIDDLEKKVNEMISQKLPIRYVDEKHIAINGVTHLCTGPRTHVRNTEEIQGFKLLSRIIYDNFERQYLVVGCIGNDSEETLKKLDSMLS